MCNAIKNILHIQTLIHIPVRFHRDLKADLTVKIFNCGYTSIQELKTTSLFDTAVQTH